MASIRQTWNRLMAMWRRDQIDSDLNPGIGSPIEATTEDNLQRGMQLQQARRQAGLRGSIAGAVEEHRGSRRLPALDNLRMDLRYSLRTLRRNHAFSCIVLLIVALGVGANVAVFSVVDTMLLQPLPFRDPHQLVWFASNKGNGGLSAQTYTVAAFEEFRRHNKSFKDITSYQTFYNSVQYKLTGHGDPLPVVAVQVAQNFFGLLGVEPILGRHFTSAESVRGGPAAALLSHRFWQRQFGGDRGIIGRTLTINALPADIRGPVTVVGVLPPSFDFGTVFSPGMRVDFYVPAYMDFWRTWGNTMAVVGRLNPGVSLAQAQREADVLFPQLRLANKNWFSDYPSKLSILHDHVSGKLRRLLMVLWWAVGLILLIVCLNISNLLLARATTREKEFAIRTALGAGRSRLVRQLLTESLLLSVGGALLGVVLAWAIVSYLAGQSHVTLPLLSTLRLDALSLAWASLIAIVVGIIFGIAPAFKISSRKLHGSLKEGGARMSEGKHHDAVRA
ncbi:MAG TPA: ABC transporter permease, partial [Bryobacteraceae bacterium]|nr:ABC transporter permease [Bryobacteraceae bacterium]